jgi:hypothetical protein
VTGCSYAPMDGFRRSQGTGLARTPGSGDLAGAGLGEARKPACSPADPADHVLASGTEDPDHAQRVNGEPRSALYVCGEPLPMSLRGNRARLAALVELGIERVGLDTSARWPGFVPADA